MIVFNEEDSLMPIMIERNIHDAVGAYHLHVEYDDAYTSQSVDSMVGLDISPSIKGLGSGK